MKQHDTEQLARAAEKQFPGLKAASIKPYLKLARTVFEDAQGSNDMGVIADLLEAKAHAERLAEALQGMMEGFAWTTEDIVRREGVGALQEDVRKAREALAQYEEARK